MSNGFRDIDLPIDDSTLTTLDGLTKDDLRQALQLSLPRSAVTRVINRLHNKQHQKAATVIKAFQLTGTGFEPMAEIDINVNSFAAHGQITNAVELGNAASIAVTILGKDRREITFLVPREDEVRIWRRKTPTGRGYLQVPDYSQPVSHGFVSAQYVAEHLTTFFGKRMSIPKHATGVLSAIEVQGDEEGVFYLTLEVSPTRTHTARVLKTDMVQVHRTLDQAPRVYREGDYPWGASRPGTASAPSLKTAYQEKERRRTTRQPTAPKPSNLGAAVARFSEAFVAPGKRADYTVTAYSVAVRTDDSYRGMTASIRQGKVVGHLTDFHLDNEGKVVLVIDGQLYKCNYGDIVRLWKRS